jgi:hypothetical protein
VFYEPLYELQTYLIGCKVRHSLIVPIFKDQGVVVVTAVVDLVIFGVGVLMGALCYVTVQSWSTVCREERCSSGRTRSSARAERILCQSFEFRQVERLNFGDNYVYRHYTLQLLAQRRGVQY